MLEWWQLALLGAAALAAGFVDSIAGGGGLITVPALLGCGLAPQLALGTNKLQASFGSGSATWHFARAGMVDWRVCWRGVALTWLGAAAGTCTVQRLDPGLLRVAIPALLLALALFMAARPAVGHHEAPPRMSRSTFDLLFGLGLGFYDGFFGPGTGTFWAMAFVLVQGFNLTRATAHTKAMNFASNIAALTFFLAAGQVNWAAGLLMGVCQWLGAQSGARLVVQRGTRFIRPVFLTVVMALTVKLLYDGLAAAR